jgi:hypothetical protein
MEFLLVGVAVLLVPLVWWIATHNRFVRLKHAIKESWADIDVELKRRYELIPNLVETVKGFARHEREVLERVVALRNQAMGNHGSPASQSRSPRATRSCRAMRTSARCRRNWRSPRTASPRRAGSSTATCATSAT